MAGESKRLVDTPSVNAIAASDTIFVTSNGAVSQITPSNLYSNLEIYAVNLNLSNTSTPANSSINVASGTMWWDANYIYIATANNTLKRVALTSF